MKVYVLKEGDLKALESELELKFSQLKEAAMHDEKFAVDLCRKGVLYVLSGWLRNVQAE